MDSTAFRVPEVLAKELARHLQEQIVFGELAPGVKLVEESIVAQYQVSRSPVREALRVLEQEGLATRQSRRGVWVSALSIADLDEVYACRLVLEALAAETAARNSAADAVKALRPELERLKAAFKQGDLRGFFLQNVRLSEAVHAASGSKTLTRLLGNVGKQALRYRYLAYSRAPHMMRVSLDANSDIVDAIECGRPPLARTLTEELMQRSWQVVREIIEAGDRPAPAAGQKRGRAMRAGSSA